MDFLTFFGMVLPWLLVCLALWLGFQFLGQMGRILLRLEALEEQLRQIALPPVPPAPAPAASGLPLGSEAPAFDLPKLTGGRATLSQYRGRKLLMVFFNPQCGFCTQMLPALAALPVEEGTGRPLPLVITTGKTDENRRMFEEHGVRCPVLIQDQMSVAAKYEVNGTPMGYLVDEHGNIASPVTIGADALVALAAPASATSDNHQAAGKVNRGLEASRINRDGLKAGTPAPDFKLPNLDGRDMALRDFRKRPVLLIFSDPQCGPCDELAPQLEKIHRQRTDMRVLMVSRRDAEENRAKAKQLGLTFPVVLQRQWEISTLYGMFATPIGYLINDAGVISAEVAVGVEQILALVGGAGGTGLNETTKRNGESRHGQLAVPKGH